jgi:capsid protein
MNALRDLRGLEHALDVDDRTRAFGQYVCCLAANNGRRAPGSVQVAKGTAGMTAQWVGAGEAKPIGEGAFGLLELPQTKVAAIAILTNELVRPSDDTAADRVAQDLAAAVGQAIDETFLSADAAVDDLSPAGILSTTTEVPSTGASAAQIEADVVGMISAVTAPLRNPYLILSPANLRLRRVRICARHASNIQRLDGDRPSRHDKIRWRVFLEAGCTIASRMKTAPFELLASARIENANPGEFVRDESNPARRRIPFSRSSVAGEDRAVAE